MKEFLPLYVGNTVLGLSAILFLAARKLLFLDLLFSCYIGFYVLSTSLIHTLVLLENDLAGVAVILSCLLNAALALFLFSRLRSSLRISHLHCGTICGLMLAVIRPEHSFLIAMLIGWLAWIFIYISLASFFATERHEDSVDQLQLKVLRPFWIANAVTYLFFWMAAGPGNFALIEFVNACVMMIALAWLVFSFVKFDPSQSNLPRRHTESICLESALVKPAAIGVALARARRANTK